jgi:nucleoside-diphosphate-sugar epimerase
LVTGGAGFLGSHLCEELSRRGHRVICIDTSETGSLANVEHPRSDDFQYESISMPGDGNPDGCLVLTQARSALTSTVPIFRLCAGQFLSWRSLLRYLPMPWRRMPALRPRDRQVRGTPFMRVSRLWPAT